MQQIVAVDRAGNSEKVARIPTTLPDCFDWLPNGRLRIVWRPEGPCLRMEPDGIVRDVDLTTFSPSV